MMSTAVTDIKLNLSTDLVAL